MRRLVAAGSLVLACVAGAGARDAAQPSPAQGACGIRQIANAGVLLTSGARTLLLDAPIREGISGYAAPDAAERERLERARPPYDRVAAILVTHWHADHFSAEAVASHLRHNPAATLVSSEEVVSRVRSVWPDLPAGQAKPTTPEPGRAALLQIGDLRVHVLRIRHNPANVTPAQHVGFLVEACRTVLHVGDADPAADNFAVLRTLPGVDVALVPFWFLTGRANRAMTASAIAPDRALAVHVPPGEAGEVSRSLAAVPRVVVLAAPGQSVELRKR